MILFSSHYSEVIKNSILPFSKSNPCQTIGVVVTPDEYTLTKQMTKSLNVKVYSLTEYGRDFSRFTIFSHLICIFSRSIRKTNFGKSLEYITLNKLYFRKLLNRVCPSVVILHDSRTLFASALARVCYEMGIPTITLQWSTVWQSETTKKIFLHNAGPVKKRFFKKANQMIAKLFPTVTYLYDNNIYWMYRTLSCSMAMKVARCLPDDNAWTFGAGLTDIVAYWGEAWRSLAVNEGLASRKKLLSLGSPIHDEWFHLRKSAKFYRLKLQNNIELNVKAGVKIVTLVISCLSHRGKDPYSGAGGIERAMSHYQKLLNKLAEIDNIVCVVRIHPRDPPEIFSRLCEQYFSRKKFFFSSLETKEVVLGSEVVLCEWSTVALMSGALSVPVIVVKFDDNPMHFFYERTEAFITLDDLSKLAECLKVVFDFRSKITAHQDNKLQGYLMLDGNSCLRLNNEIEKLVSQA